MRGVIGTRQLLSCAPTIVREFGLRCYLRCVMRSLASPGKSTFLECINPPAKRVAVLEVATLPGRPRR
jgi:hypothetical protein